MTKKLTGGFDTSEIKDQELAPIRKALEDKLVSQFSSGEIGPQEFQLQMSRARNIEAPNNFSEKLENFVHSPHGGDKNDKGDSNRSR